MTEVIAGRAVHPAATVFPLIEGAELEELVASIRANGLRDPVVLWDDGTVLDGRNRLRACEAAGVTPTFREERGVDPVKYVLDVNLHRRHLSESQRGMVAARIATLPPWRPSDVETSRPIGLLTQAEAAEALNVGGRTVRRASRVLDHGTPELVQAVERGDVAVSTASEVARLPGERQREVVARGEVEILAEAKRIREARAKANQAMRVEVAKQKAGAVVGRYGAVVIDPPWPTEKIERDVRPAQVGFDYPTMTLEGIAALPVGDWMADDCHVWLWTTHKFLPDAFNVLSAWGVRYVCTFVWHKPGGPQPMGLPQYNCEFALYGRRGSPVFVDTKALPACFEAPRGAHSEKPEAFYDVVRRITVGRRLDAFNRRAIDGFDGWGNQAAEAA